MRLYKSDARILRQVAERVLLDRGVWSKPPFAFLMGYHHFGNNHRIPSQLFHEMPQADYVIDKTPAERCMFYLMLAEYCETDGLPDPITPKEQK